MLSLIPKQRGTDKLQADIRRRIAKHKELGQKEKGVLSQKSVYSIDKEGAAQGRPQILSSSISIDGGRSFLSV